LQGKRSKKADFQTYIASQQSSKTNKRIAKICDAALDCQQIQGTPARKAGSQSLRSTASQGHDSGVARADHCHDPTGFPDCGASPGLPTPVLSRRHSGDCGLPSASPAQDLLHCTKEAHDTDQTFLTIRQMRIAFARSFSRRFRSPV
jgi:hypothetical protein